MQLLFAALRSKSNNDRLPFIKSRRLKGRICNDDTGEAQEFDYSELMQS